VSRLLALHFASRQAWSAGLALTAFAAALALALHTDWMPTSGSLIRTIPALIEAAAASVVVVATRNPFGEAERACGVRLPYLRLTFALGMTGSAVGLLVIGSTGGSVPGGDVAVLRDVSGMTGVGLLFAVLLGAAPAWLGPLSYALAYVVLIPTTHWDSPWWWPGRGPDDLGAGLCAGVTFALGVLLMSMRGPRDDAGDRAGP
jgi:hypothetical protein